MQFTVYSNTGKISLWCLIALYDYTIRVTILTTVLITIFNSNN